MRRHWLTIWLAILAWDFLSPHFESASLPMALLALALAAALLIQRRSVEAWFDARTSIVLTLVCAASAFLLPWPESLGPLLVGLGLLLGISPLTRDLLNGNVWRVPSSFGLLLVWLAAWSHVYRLVEAYFHDLDFLAKPVALAYGLFGFNAAADAPFVHLQGVGKTLSFDCSIEKFLGHALFLFLVSGLGALFLLHGRKLGWRKPMGFLALLLCFAFVRLMAMGLLLDNHGDPTNYYVRVWVFGGLLMLCLLLASSLPMGSLRGWTAWSARSWDKMSAAALAAGLAAGAFIALAFGYYDPGVAKPGRILIDEKHSNWEWSTIELNTQSYGVQTVYNYSELVRYLGYFYDIEANFEIIDDGLLENVDVLILKTPTRPYSDSEVESIMRFVERGGGLWLIGDHTNVFGMSTNLNKVARKFGMRYRFDAAIDLVTHGRQYYKRPRLFAHPSIRHLPPILMATSSTMVGPKLGQPVMVGRSLLSDELDYSVNSFFGDFAPQPDEPFGTMLQSVAVTHGRGRVLAFSDSTIFSNFFMFIRGKPELALGSVQWLMHENRNGGWLRKLFLALGVLFLLLLLVTSLNVPRQTVLLALALAMLTFVGSARALSAWVSSWSELPGPNRPLPIVAFDRGRTAYDIPDIRDIPEDSPHSFHTFYVWTQRVGFVPTTRLFEKFAEGSESLVLINPIEHFTPEDMQKLSQFVEGGGTLLVLDSAHARHSTAAEILQPFGLSFAATAMESVLVTDIASGDSLAVIGNIRPVVGGETIFSLPDGQAPVAYQDIGQGRVVAMCASYEFSNAVLGTTSEVPTPEQLALYQLQFRIFDELLRPRHRQAAAAVP